MSRREIAAWVAVWTIVALVVVIMLWIFVQPTPLASTRSSA